MKHFLNKSKLIYALLAVILLAGVSACNMTDPDLPFDLEGTLSNNGAYLRVLKYDTKSFDLADPQTAKFVMTVEYYDGKKNPALDNVEFFVDYSSFSLKPGNDPNQVIKAETTAPILKVPASAFSKNDNGNLQATISVPLKAATDALGLNINSVGVEDRFGLRWVVNTTEGKSYSENDRSTAVAGGFYNSPYFSNVFTVQALAETKFVGNYQFVQQEPGAIAPLGINWLFGQTFTAELSVDPANPLNGRVFTAAPYPAFGVLPSKNVTISLGRTSTMSGAAQSTGIGCGIGLYFGPARSGLVEIDVNDDSSFKLVISENTESDCGVGPKSIVFDVTKL